MSQAETFVTQDELLRTSYGMIALTSVFAVTRVAIRVYRPKAWAMEDFFIVLAFILYLTLTTLYIIVTPILFRLSAFASGAAPPYPGLKDDSYKILKIFFATTELFWFTLWSVKFSLLALYKRLLVGLNSGYVKLWWAVVVFCVLSLTGCIVSNIKSCHSMHAWWTPGECNTPRDIRAQITSLYYAFAVDVLSDLMIMLLPIKLIWNLQMPRAQKISVGALFGTGLICILFATIRVVSIGSKAGKNKQPNTSWLALWAVVECSIAVIIGCCPAFAAFYHKSRSTVKGGYNAHGYSKQPSVGAHRSNDVPLKNIVSTSRSKNRDTTFWDDANSSQEQLADKGGIMVTKEFKHEHSHTNGDSV